MSWFQRIECIQGDLTCEAVDAIVNAANTGPRGGGGIDGAIHRAAGPDLLRELVERFPQGCEPGDAVVTHGHRRAARWVIHTPGPVWQGGDAGEPKVLARCHRESLLRAREVGARSVAFPAISCGVYGYPHAEAARIALGTVAAEIARHPQIERVRFVLFSRDLLDAFAAARARLATAP
jgi:O-acetyl-ADP-ribose deacetylase (regulator of RNase III)